MLFGAEARLWLVKHLAFQHLVHYVLNQPS